MNKKLWFKSKKYGWGWTPVSWEGWLSILVLMLYVVWEGIQFEQSGEENLEWYLFRLFIIILLILLLGFWKGEKPRWRWGD